jgi:hypothetical protein
MSFDYSIARCSSCRSVVAAGSAVRDYGESSSIWRLAMSVHCTLRSIRTMPAQRMYASLGFNKRDRYFIMTRELQAAEDLRLILSDWHYRSRHDVSHLSLWRGRTQCG